MCFQQLLDFLAFLGGFVVRWCLKGKFSNVFCCMGNRPYFDIDSLSGKGTGVLLIRQRTV